jgi:hypothetical protein
VNRKKSTILRALAGAAAALSITFGAMACGLFPQEGEVTEVEQEIDTTELTVYCDGEETDIDIPQTDRWEVGDIYGCERRPEDQHTTSEDN